MPDKNFDDSNWMEEMKAYTTNTFHLELLEKGAKSLSQSWILGALYQKWKRIKGIPPAPEPPDCQSSFTEWEKKAKQIEEEL